MAVPPRSFSLDRSIFNQTLYAHLREFWFEGVPPNATAATLPALQRWYGAGRTQEQKSAFDEECRVLASPALDAVGPTKFTLPPFNSYDDEIAHAEGIAAPFLADVEERLKEDTKKGADTLLSLILLLDQMPRNMYRDQEGLRLVYGHYDRLAFSLIHSSMRLSPNPVEHECWRGKPSYHNWLLLPFVHAEHLPSHVVAQQSLAQKRRECEEAKDEDALRLIDAAEKAHVQHEEPLRRFGRYPHRNECLGRENTAEEDEYLTTANTFGVKQVKKSQAKDEL